MKKKRNGEIIGFRDFNENLYYECLKRFQLHENRNFSFRKDFNSSFFTQPTFTSSYFFQFFFLTETFNKEASFFRGVHIRRPRFNHSIFQQFQQFIHVFFSCFNPLLTLNLISSHIQTLEAIYEYPYLFAPEYILHI